MIRPGDQLYDSARAIWNGAIDKRPAAILRCTGVADVVQAVRFAREENLTVSVKGGGHNVAGTAVCDDGLMLDLSAMKGMRVDPITRTARGQPGLLWGEFDRETQVFGLAAPGGVVTHTGIAGLTLGGGIGWLMRKHGLTCDNLLSADVVTADGQFVRASSDENPDLFWGLKGGGGNFGIVTSFEYALHPLGPTVMAGVVVHPAEQAARVLAFYRDYIAAAPDELNTIANLRWAPPAPWLPQGVHGRPVVVIAVLYAGPVEEAEPKVKPLRTFGEPLVDLIRPTPYVAHQGMFDASVPHGWRYYWKSQDIGTLTGATIDALVAHAWQAPSHLSYTIIFHLGGAVRRISEAGAAFGGRAAEHTININSVWTEPAEDPTPHTTWARTLWSALQPFATGSVYINFLGDEGEERVKAAYGREKFERLAALKRQFDATNFFRVNQNIRPAE